MIALAVIAALLLWRQTGNHATAAGVASAAQDVAAPAEPMLRKAQFAGGQAQPAPAALDIPEQRAHQLLARHFPAQYRSAQLHRVWMVVDEDGALVLSGEMKGQEELRDLDEQLGRGLAGRTPGPWRTLQLQNLAGQRIDFSLSQVVLGEGRKTR